MWTFSFEAFVSSAITEDNGAFPDDTGILPALTAEDEEPAG